MGRRIPLQPDDLPEPQTHPSDPERCDRAYVERARWRAVSPTTGKDITLCNYHFRAYQIPLAIAGWAISPID